MVSDDSETGRLLTVSEAAAKLGVTPATLRNWDRAGKLKPIRHPLNKYRLYESKVVERLKDAIHGKTSTERE